MPKLSFICYLLCVCQCVLAQVPVSMADNRPVLKIDRLYGKLIDGVSFRAIDGATIQVIIESLDSSAKKRHEGIIATEISDKKGEFSFENLSLPASCILRFSAAGYQTYSQKASFDTGEGDMTGGNAAYINAGNKDIGNIRLIRDVRQLQAVTVNSSQSLLQLNLDKKVYNVEKDFSATGGTGVDVMKNIPSVNVDIDGNITLRNASPLLFVDGRPTTLTPDQIPADQISTVEIMTNPSAKYDAGGGGSGILNIVLKKNRKSGYNGNIRASIDSRGKPGIGGDINLKQNKVNIFASGNLAYRKSITTVYTDRTDNFLNGNAHYTQDNKPVNASNFSFGRVGMDYFINNRNTLSLSGSVAGGRFRVHDLLAIYIDTVTGGNLYKQSALRSLDVKANFQNYGSSLGFKHNFARSGREFTADANFNYNQNSNTSVYNSLLFDADHDPIPSPGTQKATGGGSTRYYVIQADYADPFTSTQKIEFGARLAMRNYNNWNDNYLQTPGSQGYMLLPLIGVRYDYNDRVFAAYGSYSQQIKAFSYQVGLRVENSEYNGNFTSKGQEFSNNYPLSLFPGAFLTYKLNDRQDFQLNYSRKVNRPNFFQLIPFVDFSDSLNLTVGNPSLRPEFTQLAEFAWSNQYSPGNTILVSIYGKLTHDLITRYQYLDSLINPAKPGRYTTFVNADQSITEGIELTAQNKVTSWWDITSNLNLFNVNIKAGNLTPGSDLTQAGWFAKLNNIFKLPSGFSLQVSGDYQAKTILPPAGGGARAGLPGSGYGSSAQTTAQGYLNPTWGADMAVRKELFRNNSGLLTLQFNDIFRSRVYSTHAETMDFTQNNRRYRDPQLLRLNFAWRFGKIDATLFKRKNNKGEQESLQNLQTGQ